MELIVRISTLWEEDKIMNVKHRTGCSSVRYRHYHHTYTHSHSVLPPIWSPSLGFGHLLSVITLPSLGLVKSPVPTISLSSRSQMNCWPYNCGDLAPGPCLLFHPPSPALWILPFSIYKVWFCLSFLTDVA